MSRRVVSVLCFVGILALAVSGVAAGTVTIWETRAPGNDFRQYEIEWNRLAGMIKEELGIDIELYYYGDDVPEKLIATYGTDAHPDLTTEVGWDMAFKGLYEDLTPYIERDGFDLSPYPKPALDYWNIDGAQYVLPQGFGHGVLAYNVSLFDRLGLAIPPTDWEDPNWTVDAFTDLIQKGTEVSSDGRYTRLGIGDLPNFFAQTFWWGASWMDENGVATPEHPGILSALRWGRELVESGIYPQGAPKGAVAWDDEERFATGDILMVAADDDDFGDMTESIGDAFEWNIAPFPHVVRPATYGAVWGYTLMAGSDNKEEAWKVLKWLETEPSTAALTVRYSFRTPVRPDLMDAYLSLKGTVLPANLNHEVILNAHMYSPVPSVLKSPNGEAVEEYVEGSIRQVLSGATSEKSWAENAKTRINAILRQ